MFHHLVYEKEKQLGESDAGNVINFAATKELI